MQKTESKNGGTEPENQGSEPQSARAGAVETHFRTFWKNSKNHRKCIQFSSLFHSFFAPFSSLFQKSRKRCPVSGPKAIKIHQNGPQGCPNGAQESTNPKAPQRTKNMQNCPRRVGKWSRKSYNGAPRPPPNARKHTKKVSKVIIKHENGPQSLENTQEHIDTNNQPSKETSGDTNRQRPLESSFELQTQTQTPAAGCSPKAT